MTDDYRSRSFWLDDVATGGDDLTRRAPLPGARDVDVAIVGAGLHRLVDRPLPARSRPDAAHRRPRKGDRRFRRVRSQRRLVQCAFSCLDGKDRGDVVARRGDRDAPRDVRQRRRGRQRRGEATASTATTTRAARCRSFAVGPSSRAPRAKLEDARAWGATESDLTLLGPDETAARVHATDALGALFTPHCAAIHPAKLVRGLAALVEQRGAAIYEGTRVTAISPHRVDTRQRRRASRRRRARDRGLHADDPRTASRVRAGLLADARHRAATCRNLGRRGVAAARNLQRHAPPHHLRAAHAPTVGWRSAAVVRRTTTVRASRRRSIASRRFSRRYVTSWSSCSRH